MEIGILQPHEIYEELKRKPHRKRKSKFRIGTLEQDRRRNNESVLISRPYKGLEGDLFESISVYGITDGYDYSLTAKLETDYIFSSRDRAEIGAKSFLEDITNNSFTTSGKYVSPSLINLIVPCIAPKSIDTSKEVERRDHLFRGEKKYVAEINLPTKKLPSDGQFMEDLSHFVYQIQTLMETGNKKAREGGFVKGKSNDKLYLYDPVPDYFENSEIRKDLVNIKIGYAGVTPLVFCFTRDKKASSNAERYYG